MTTFEVISIAYMALSTLDIVVHIILDLSKASSDKKEKDEDK